MNNTNSHLVSTETPLRICWSAVISGALIAVGLGFLLQLYGVAIGLSAYHSSPASATTLAIGGFIALIIGIIASMGVAGFVSGYLGRFHYHYCHGGVIYGFLTWSIALLLSAIMLLPLTHYTSMYSQSLTSTASLSNSLFQNSELTTGSNKETKGTKETKGSKETQANVKGTPNDSIGSSWIVFILFFIGALSSCIGACWGMNCKRSD